ALRGSNAKRVRQCLASRGGHRARQSARVGGAVDRRRRCCARAAQPMCGRSPAWPGLGHDHEVAERYDWNIAGKIVGDGEGAWSRTAEAVDVIEDDAGVLIIEDVVVGILGLACPENLEVVCQQCAVDLPGPRKDVVVDPDRVVYGPEIAEVVHIAPE